jgi:broad specificity polyphosphatase/5'/3'-nucleotidase SurE
MRILLTNDDGYMAAGLIALENGPIPGTRSLDSGS